MTGLVKSPVRFDAAAHTYTLGDRSLSGVTSLMKRHGLSPDYSDVPAAVLKRAADRGSAIHGVVQDCINGMYEPEIASPAEKEVADMWEAFRHGNGLRPVEAEYLVSDNETVASKIDIVLDDCSLADLKTTSELHVGALSWQLSIYACLFEMQNPGLKVPALYGVHYDVRKKVFSLHGVARHPDAEVARLLECERTGAEFVPDAPPVTEDETAIISYVERERLPSIIGQLAHARAVVEELQARLDAAYSAMYAQMEKAGIDKIEGRGYTITRRAPSVRTTIDGRALREEMPEIAARYTKNSQVKGSVAIKIKDNNKP